MRFVLPMQRGEHFRTKACWSLCAIHVVCIVALFSQTYAFGGGIGGLHTIARMWFLMLEISCTESAHDFSTMLSRVVRDHVWAYFLSC